MSVRQKVSRRSVFTAKCPHGEMSLRRSVRTVKCPYGEVSIRRNVRTTKCHTAKRPTVKSPTGKIPVTGLEYLCSIGRYIVLCRNLMNYSTSTSIQYWPFYYGFFFFYKKSRLDPFSHLSIIFLQYTGTEISLEHWKTLYSSIFSQGVSNSILY